MNGTLFDVVALFLSKEKIQVDKRSLKKHLPAHPYYPSLLSLTQTLADFGILLSVVDSDWDILQDCKQRVLLHLKEEKDVLVIFDHIMGNTIHYVDGDGEVYQEDKSAFLAKWDGVLVGITYVDSEKQARIKKRSNERRGEKVVLVVSALVLVTSILINGGASEPFFWILFVLKLAGCITSYFLVKHALGHAGKLEEKVCHMGKSTDCNAVLTSPAAKLFKRIGMSDIGVVYFSGGMVALLISILSHTGYMALVMLSLLSYCAIPYTLFSLCYQRWVVKKWCPFCLIVIAILWLEAIVGYFIFTTIDFAWDWVLWGQGVFLFLFLSVAWSLLLDRLKRIVEMDNTEFEYFRWKKNDRIFYLQWQSQPELKAEDMPPAIQLGDPSAPICITLEVGLNCNPCSKAYDVLYHILSEEPEDFQARLHIASGSAATETCSYLLSLYRESGGDAFSEGLKYWYASFDYEGLVREYPVKDRITANEQGVYAKQHEEWEKKYEIDRTPAIFVNGRRLPKNYQMEDLRYFSDLF